MRAVNDIDPTGFSWWDRHDASARRARMLFCGVAVILAMYVYAPLMIVAAVIRAAEVGPWRGVATIANRVGVLGLAAGAVALVAASAAAIVLVAWRGFPSATARRAGGRRPESVAEQRVAQFLEGGALVNGIAAPRYWVIDDPVPNALAFGRPRAGHVGVTTGALELSDRELEALCMFEVTALAMPSFAYATSAIDLVLVAEWCARVLWMTAVLGLWSALFGVPIEVAAGYTVGIAVIVMATRPILVVANRALPRLLAATAELIDLDTVNHSAQPSALAHLLLRLLEDRGRTASSWRLTHLWFEPDVVERANPAGGIVAFLVSIAPASIGTPRVIRRHESAFRRSLLERATRAVNLADGDHKLRRRLERVEQSVTR